MTFVDMVAIGIVAVSVLLGAMRGFVREFLSLAAWAAALWCANHFAANIAEMLPPGLSGAPLRTLVAFAGIFVCALIVIALFTKLLSGLVKGVGLGWVDGLLGFAFGLARGGLIVVVLALMSGMTSFPDSVAWRNAKFRGPIESSAIMARSWLPEGLSRHIRFESEKFNYR
ncbi:MAG: CvpA family protein [Burkholderiales bacterium]|nr:CvpA family protein [Burkholderiales bacterium]